MDENKWKILSFWNIMFHKNAEKTNIIKPCYAIEIITEFEFSITIKTHGVTQTNRTGYLNHMHDYVSNNPINRQKFRTPTVLL